MQPDLRHPLGVAHRARPGADHVGWLRPAAIDDRERVEQFGFPIAPPARLAPGERGQSRDDRPHVFRIGHHVAERRLHPPQTEDNVAVDAVVLLNPRKQTCVFLCALFPVIDPPVGAASVDVLPHQFGEFGLRTVSARLHAAVRRHRAHHAVVSLFRDATLDRARAKSGHPTRKSG